MADTAADAPSDRYQEEHRRIGVVVTSLEAALAADCAPSAWVCEAARHLAGLGEVLGPHFRGEREGALYTEAPERAPQFSAKLDRLMAEHQTFLTELGAITAEALGALDPDATLVGRVRARTVALIEELRRHEEEENEILVASFWDDLGAGD